MTDHAVSPEVRLAGDIAEQFAYQEPAAAAAAVAEHIRSFWDPRMRRNLLAVADAGAALDPPVQAAVNALRALD